MLFWCYAFRVFAAFCVIIRWAIFSYAIFHHGNDCWLFHIHSLLPICCGWLHQELVFPSIFRHIYVDDEQKNQRQHQLSTNLEFGTHLRVPSRNNLNWIRMWKFNVSKLNKIELCECVRAYANRVCWVCLSYCLCYLAHCKWEFSTENRNKHLNIEREREICKRILWLIGSAHILHAIQKYPCATVELMGSVTLSAIVTALSLHLFRL